MQARIRAPESRFTAAPLIVRTRVKLPPTRANRCVVSTNTFVVSSSPMTSAEFKRWLRRQGCTFEPGKGGHLIVRRGNRMSVLPMHGTQKELGTGLVKAIKKDLGLE